MANRNPDSAPWTQLAIVLAVCLLTVIPMSAAGSGWQYSIDFKAANPEEYPQISPDLLSCPGGGRLTNPLAGAQHEGGVESLALHLLDPGQIVVFEFHIHVSDSAAEDGSVHFSGSWGTQTTSGEDFGFDESYGIYCAFVDAADPTAQEPNLNSSVTESSWFAADDAIQGTFTVDGLNPGEDVVVEVWMVLDGAIPAGSNDTVHSQLTGAHTYPEGARINTGNQTVPIHLTDRTLCPPADVAVTKIDSGFPVERGDQFDYTITVANLSSNRAAHSVKMIDTLDPNTEFVDILVYDFQGSSTYCHEGEGIVTCCLGMMKPEEIVTIVITVQVSETAPTDAEIEDGTCTQDSQDSDLCNLTEILSSWDDNDINNTDSEPTDVVTVPTPPVDTDGDGIPDDIEGTEDADGDGTPNFLDLDSDGDGIPDEVETADDADGDGTPNFLDLDSDDDGIPDEVETADDADGDGTPNFLDLDSDDDGIPDEVETADDADGDGTPNFLDLDSDGDGIPDQVETADDADGDGTPNFLDLDSDDDGIPDQVETADDADSDGTPNFLDLDSDDDGIPDEVETSDDADGDGTPNFLDLDSDGDGLLDNEEWSTGSDDPLVGCTADDPVCYNNDADGDTTPNFLDLDSDDDGNSDEEEGTVDSNDDGIPDWLDPDSVQEQEFYYVYLPLIPGPLAPIAPFYE